MTQQKLTKTVALIGMMGAGKTAIGRALAERIGVAFIDSDEEIARAADITIPEIFARDGEAFFRERETEVIERLLREECAVLSTGGGAYLSDANKEMMRKNGVTLWLDADIELLWSRVRHKDTRPLLRTDNPYETLKTLYEARLPHYQQADIRVTAEPDFSIEDMCDRVVAALQEQHIIVGEQ